MAYKTPNVRASTLAWADLKAGGLNAILDGLVAANTALTAPSSQATVSTTAGAATSLAAGVYYASYTFSNTLGETTVGTGRSNSFTIILDDTDDKPRITVPSLPTGASGINIYLTAAGGAAGSEKLYATGVTTTTYNATSATWLDSAKGIPSSNTTAMSNILEQISMMKTRRWDQVMRRINSNINNFISGQPIDMAEARAMISRDAALIKALSTALDEIGTLVEANPGTVLNQSRTWS